MGHSNVVSILSLFYFKASSSRFTSHKDNSADFLGKRERGGWGVGGLRSISFNKDLSIMLLSKHRIKIERKGSFVYTHKVCL